MTPELTAAMIDVCEALQDFLSGDGPAPQRRAAARDALWNLAQGLRSEPADTPAPDESAALAAPQPPDVAHQYEELRAAIDGGSESMTHEDALAVVRACRCGEVVMQPAQPEPVGEVRHMADNPAAPKTVVGSYWSLPVGTKLYTAPTRKPPTDEELAPIVRDYDALLSEREQMMAQHREDVDKLNDAVVAWKTECERLTARLRQEEDEHVRTAAMCRTASNERDALRAELNLALYRITDTLDEGDDGRRWREVEKFLKRHRPQEGTL